MISQKNRVKKSVAILLVLTMLFTLLPFGAFAADTKVQTGEAQVSFGDKKAYDVKAEVTVTDGKIADVALSHNAGEAGHEKSVSYAEKAKTVADGFKNLSVTDKKAMEAVDTVTGATITSKAYKAAILDALDLKEEAGFPFGSMKQNLEPGTYSVPVSLKNALHHEENSLAAGAFPSPATLTVAKDGSASLKMTVKPVTIGPITDMAYDMKYYKEDNTDGKALPITVLKTIVKPETMPGGSKEVPTEISFTIPDNTRDGVYVNFTVDAMGPGYPDAWIEIDYKNAKAPGNTETREGSAKVDQFGKYTIYATVSLRDGVISGVSFEAKDWVSETFKDTNVLKTAQAKEALKDVWNGITPSKDNAETIFKAIMSKENPDDVIDSISGATYSAKACRDAVMNAFGLTYEDEVINIPKEVLPGIYNVEIGYYSDVVWHSLVEDVKGDATLIVNEDKSMLLDFETKSGTEKEPLYILDFNGVYPDNNPAQKLSKEGCKAVFGLSSNDYSDENFEKGTKVVNHLTFPLYGDLSKVYHTNAYLYVPAMKRLNGELSGITFKNGKFNVDCFAKIYWDTLTKTGDVPTVKPEHKVFRDVPENHWAKNDIYYAVENGIFGGVSDTQFAPEGTMTRGMFVTVLGRIAGIDADKYKNNTFSDVNAGDWYAPYVAWGVQSGLVKGMSATEFAPNDPVRRQDMAVFLERFCKIRNITLTEKDSVSFADATQIDSYAKGSVETIANAGLIKGMEGNRFSPKTSATRAQVAALVVRFVKEYSL